MRQRKRPNNKSAAELIRVALDRILASGQAVTVTVDGRGAFYTVRSEAPTREGVWLEDPESDDYKCSACGEFVEWRTLYCPECGAVMRDQGVSGEKGG